MTCTAHIPAQLRSITKGAVVVSLSGPTVDAALQDLVGAYPGVGSHLFDDRGELRSFVSVIVGDQDVRFGRGLETQVTDGQEIWIVPAMAGE